MNAGIDSRVNTWKSNIRPHLNGQRVRWDELKLNLLAGEYCDLELEYEDSWMTDDPEAIICMQYVPGEEGEGVEFDPPLGHLCEMQNKTSLCWRISTAHADIGAVTLQFLIPPISEMPPSPSIPLEVLDVPMEVEVMFDKIPVAFDTGITAYPCHGATHTIVVRRKPTSYLKDREVMLLWDGDSAGDLGVKVSPDLNESQLLTLAGITWQLNCTDTIGDGNFSLRLRAVQSGITTGFLPMSLGHNLVSAEKWRTGPHHHHPGSTFYLKYIRATSVHTQKPTRGVDVLINGSSSGVTTDGNGEAVTAETSLSKDMTIKNRYDGSVV